MVFSSNRDFRLTYGQHFVCAGLAGITAKLLTAPLDVVKIRTQVGSSETHNGIMRTFTNIGKTEGLKAFWKGNLMGCARVMPYSLLQVVAFQRLRIMLADNTGRLTSATALMAGSGAGLFATLALYPTDVIKTRLIIEKGQPQYHTILNAARTIVKEEGYRGFYKGMLTSVIGSVPYAASMFLSYETFDKFQRRSLLSDNYNFLFSFSAGCVASAVAQTVSYPFDTVRKQMQAQCGRFTRDQRIDINASGMTEAVSSTIQKYGLTGLWKGNLVNLIRVIPYTAAMFFTYEMTKSSCLQSNGYVAKPFDHLSDDINQSLTPEELEEFIEEISLEEYT